MPCLYFVPSRTPALLKHCAAQIEPQVARLLADGFVFVTFGYSGDDDGRSRLAGEFGGFNQIFDLDNARVFADPEQARAESAEAALNALLAAAPCEFDLRYALQVLGVLGVSHPLMLAGTKKETVLLSRAVWEALSAAPAGATVNNFFLSPLLKRGATLRSAAALTREAYALVREHRDALVAPLAAWRGKHFGAGGKLLRPEHVFYQLAKLSDVELRRFAFFAMHTHRDVVLWDDAGNDQRRSLARSRQDQVMAVYNAVME